LFVVLSLVKAQPCSPPPARQLLTPDPAQTARSRASRISAARSQRRVRRPAHGGLFLPAGRAVPRSWGTRDVRSDRTAKERKEGCDVAYMQGTCKCSPHVNGLPLRLRLACKCTSAYKQIQIYVQTKFTRTYKCTCKWNKILLDVNAHVLDTCACHMHLRRGGGVR